MVCSRAMSEPGRLESCSMSLPGVSLRCRRCVARVVCFVAGGLVVSACTLAYPVHELGEGGANDAGAKRFCQAHQPTPTFCDDFDDSDKNAGFTPRWKYEYQNPGGALFRDD